MPLPEDRIRALEARTEIPDGSVQGTRLTWMGTDEEGDQEVAWTSEVDPQVFEGHGDPNTALNAPKGSLYTELDAPGLWQNADGADTWTQVGGGSSITTGLLIEQNSPATGFGIGASNQLAEFDTIYTDDPAESTTASVVPGGYGLTGYMGFTGPNALPFDRLKTTTTGFWLVSFAVQIDQSDPTQIVSPFIEGDYMSPIGPFINPIGGNLSGNELGVTWLYAMTSGQEMLFGLARDDTSATYQGITYAAARIVRIA